MYGLFHVLNVFTHCVGFLEFGVAGNLVGSAYAAAEQVSLEAAFAVAVNPALQAALGALGDEGLVLGGGGEEVDVAEAVVLGVHGVHAVDEGLHLAAHLVVVDGRGPADHVGIEDALHDGGHIVLEDAGTRLLAREAAHAEADFLAAQRDEFHLVPRGFRTAGKLLRQSVAVRAGTETG